MVEKSYYHNKQKAKETSRGDETNHLGAGSNKNKGWSNSTGEESSTKILTIFPENSDSISLKSFIASITHKTSPSEIKSPFSMKLALSGDGFL